jgi:hypothetical protein
MRYDLITVIIEHVFQTLSIHQSQLMRTLHQWPIVSWTCASGPIHNIDATSSTSSHVSIKRELQNERDDIGGNDDDQETKRTFRPPSVFVTTSPILTMNGKRRRDENLGGDHTELPPTLEQDDSKNTASSSAAKRSRVDPPPTEPGGSFTLIAKLITASLAATASSSSSSSSSWLSYLSDVMSTCVDLPVWQSHTPLITFRDSLSLTMSCQVYELLYAPSCTLDHMRAMCVTICCTPVPTTSNSNVNNESTKKKDLTSSHMTGDWPLPRRSHTSIQHVLHRRHRLCSMLIKSAILVCDLLR